MISLYYLQFGCITSYFFFFFNDTATTEIYTLSLHDALPIFSTGKVALTITSMLKPFFSIMLITAPVKWFRSEEHTSELQSHSDLVCRLLLEKKKKYRSSLHRLIFHRQARL